MRSWLAVLRGLAKRAKSHNITDRAATLTYYGILSIFPALLVVVSLIGVIGDPEKTTTQVLDALSRFVPKAVLDELSDPINKLARNTGTATTLLSVGLVAAVWAASGYVGAFIRSMNAVYDVEEKRPFWKLRPLQLLLTILGLLAAAVVAVGFALSGPVASWLGDKLNLGDSVVQLWGILKWPVIAVTVILMLALLYWATPDLSDRRFRLLTTGSAAAVLLWALVSAGFGVYVARFGHYDRTYGALGAVIIFLVWLWLTNLVILFGAELDAEIASRDAEESDSAGPSKAPESMR